MFLPELIDSEAQSLQAVWIADMRARLLAACEGDVSEAKHHESNLPRSLEVQGSSVRLITIEQLSLHVHVCFLRSSTLSNI